MPSATAPYIEGHNLDFDELAAAAGVAFNADQRERIVRAANDYLTTLALEARKPKRGDVAGSLDAIHHHARALAAIIGDVNQQDAVNLALPPGIEPDELAAALRRVQRQATASRHQMPGKHGGRRTKAPRADLIGAIRALWQDATNRRDKGACYDDYQDGVRGPLLDLMDNLLAQLGEWDQRADDDRKGLAEACR